MHFKIYYFCWISHGRYCFHTVAITAINLKYNIVTKVKKDKINLNKDFWVFTGSSVGVVPIKGKGIYIGKIEKLGSVKTQIK